MVPGQDNSEHGGAVHVVRVGDSTLMAFARGGGWVVRVQRPDWGGDALEIDDRFSTEAEALDWCAKMAEAFRRDDIDPAD